MKKIFIGGIFSAFRAFATVVAVLAISVTDCLFNLIFFLFLTRDELQQQEKLCWFCGGYTFTLMISSVIIVSVFPMSNWWMLVPLVFGLITGGLTALVYGLIARAEEAIARLDAFCLSNKMQ